MRRSKRGFTLLEVIIAGALFAFVTAAAMASYVLQVQLTNTQQQSSNATDSQREAMRLIGNDVRAAAPGINAALISGGTSNLCPVGTIPYSVASATGPACLPAVFRSTSPLAPFGNVFPNNCGQGTSPGYQLQISTNVFEPSAGGATGPSAAYFCPDDLVILAVDDSNSFFAQGLPVSSLNAATLNFLFMPPPLAAAPTSSTLDENGASALLSNPMILISGANGPVLINSGTPAVVPTYTSSTGTAPVTDYQVAQVPLVATQWDMFGSIGTGTPVAMPARLVQYSIEPINATGGTVAPFVSANLVRTELTPTGTTPWFTAGASVVLVKGVIDMQVEFGLDPLGTGQLRYVNSGGYQLTSVVPPATTASVETPENHVSAACGGAASAQGLFAGACFPSNDIQYIRSVRLNLLVRAGTITNSRASPPAAGGAAGVAQGNTAGVAAPFFLQPAVQDLPTGNMEASSWNWPNAPFAAGSVPFGYPTVDGAEYREVSSEIFVRNLGLTNNF